MKCFVLRLIILLFVLSNPTSCLSSLPSSGGKEGKQDPSTSSTPLTSSSDETTPLSSSAQSSRSSFPSLSLATTKPICEYHPMGPQPQQREESGGDKNGEDTNLVEPVENDDFSTNPTVFGRILDGTIPAITIKETSKLLAFQDKTPRAPLHALVIPKQYIPTVKSLTSKDLPILYDMHHLALDIIKYYYPQAYNDKDYILCYHIPPFNSVNHLHLHVLAPKSKMSWMYSYGKYLVGTCWCTNEESLFTKLQEEDEEEEEDTNMKEIEERGS